MTADSVTSFHPMYWMNVMQRRRRRRGGRRFRLRCRTGLRGISPAARRPVAPSLRADSGPVARPRPTATGGDRRPPGSDRPRRARSAESPGSRSNRPPGDRARPPPIAAPGAATWTTVPPTHLDAQVWWRVYHNRCVTSRPVNGMTAVP